MGKVNLHTHTTYCDGKNTPEELVLAAIDKGFSVLGFSGHSYTAFDESYCMSKAGTARYQAEIRTLAQRYRDQIQLLCGVEQDFFSESPTTSYDYVIGSVHAIYKPFACAEAKSPLSDTPHLLTDTPHLLTDTHGVYIYVDWDAETLVTAADQYYGGDLLALAEDYYATVAQVVSRTGCQIIGHFDLLTKFNEQQLLFDTMHPRYIAAVDQALAALLPMGAIFEINTGAMAKGYRTTPYPSAAILKKIASAGGKIMINTDCHFANALDYGFIEARKLAKSCGFSSLVTVDRRGRFVEEAL